ncbi:MAG: hypothetical protein IGS49_06580 [Chlorogloeopsis fritschii C42_A2020_084]|uniref:hypothetical protein n=1 Tax=Chlorogloeopsis fritschii TaxID=1124 RepID=UPI0019E7EA55|nr:hypothetical protein [Chlorogloeopsis fritschii]MBF2005126.1 hypothetical protein [Chlorogloeopsis fritschii C42_A2020_084]
MSAKLLGFTDIAISLLKYSSNSTVAATIESKYRIRGATTDGGEVEIIAKLGLTGKLVIITVYVP